MVCVDETHVLWIAVAANLITENITCFRTFTWVVCVKTSTFCWVIVGGVSVPLFSLGLGYFILLLFWTNTINVDFSSIFKDHHSLSQLNFSYIKKKKCDFFFFWQFFFYYKTQSLAMEPLCQKQLTDWLRLSLTKIEWKRLRSSIKLLSRVIIPSGILHSVSK